MGDVRGWVRSMAQVGPVHRVVGVGRDLKHRLVPTTPCFGQGHLPLGHVQRTRVSFQEAVVF